MSDLLQEYAPQIIATALSLTAVGVSLFKAQAQESLASAKAVTELAASSQTARQRIGELEEDNRLKDLELESLREQVARIPSLEAQVQYLTDEIGALRREADAMRDRFAGVIAEKEAEIRALTAAGPAEGE
ncbi:MAG: hypothetical protein AAF653_10750 [Chloroflexota bacterium]